MSIEKRKVGFYSLRLNNNGECVHPSQLRHLIKFVSHLPKEERGYDIGENKFCNLERLNISKFGKNIDNLTFFSGKFNHRPPLIHHKTSAERDSPKLLEEAEKENTHVAIKYLDDEVIVILEERKVGVSLVQMLTYFRRFLNIFIEDKPEERERFNIKFSIIPKDDFYKEINKLKRISYGEIYSDKSVFTNEYEGLRETENFQLDHEMILRIKSKRGFNIQNVIRNVWNMDKKKVRKIRAYGVGQDGNAVLLDTDIMKKIEYVSVELNPVTGIVKAETIFPKFDQILIDFNN